MAPTGLPRRISGDDIMVSISPSSIGVPGTEIVRGSCRVSFTISDFPEAIILPVIPSPTRKACERSCSLYVPWADATLTVLLSFWMR